MEAREITIIETKRQKKSVIMSSAETLGELKSDLLNAGIDYTDMAFYEGVSKTELKSDDSPLPRDLQYKGQTTNKLVFMLTNANKKIKSGSMQRATAYNKIKQYNLQEECIKRFGKNFTQCKTDDLISLIFEVEKSNLNLINEIKQPDTQKEACDRECTIPESYTKEIKEIKALKDAIINLYELMLDYDYFGNEDIYKCKNILKQLTGKEICTKSCKDAVKSSFSDKDIEEMFSGMIE